MSALLFVLSPAAFVLLTFIGGHIWASWMAERRRNERIAAKLHLWRNIRAPKPEFYQSSAWTGR